MGCRRDQATLTTTERTAFANAVLALKKNVPSQMGLTNRYDDYVQVHMDSMMASPAWAHQGPAFLPWHRELLRRFELDLQVVDSTVTIPYWDWTVNNAADPAAAGSPWTNDLMGGNGDPAQNWRVTTGPFTQAAGWTHNVLDPGDPSPFLRRRFGSFPGAGTLPTGQNVTDCLAVTPYDADPWDTTVPANAGFRNRLEGWVGTGSIHNRVHLWVAGPDGTMFWMTSPNDPVFWMHHCNIDRLWAIWQQQHSGEPYAPPSGTPGAPAGHGLNDSMQPWGGTTTPASVVNHHALGYWYDTDPPQITLLTPSVSFVDIPEGIGGTGVTTYRAIRFEVQACEDIHVNVTAGPTAGFGLPLGSSLPIPASHEPPPAIGRLWISYTSTTAGDTLTGSVTVQVVETGQSWVINLSANTVSRPKSAIALVLDHSGSMSEDAGDGTPKVAKLREAVSIFSDVMLEGDGLSIVRFDDTVQRLFDVTDVGPVPATPGSGRELAGQVVSGNQLDPAGLTSIGGGVAEGKLALDTAPATVPPYSVRAMVVLTDGMENTPPMIADVGSSITANTFAIGLGMPANISVDALNQLTKGTGGFFVVTGAITPDQTFRLTKYFLQALAGITNANVVVDPEGELVLGATHRIPFWLSEADMGVDAILLTPAPNLIDFRLETPEGQVIDPARAGAEPNIEYVSAQGVSYFRAGLPALPGPPGEGHAGRWHALLRLGRRRGRQERQLLEVLRAPSLPYSFLVHSYSNLRFTAALEQERFLPHSDVLLAAGLSEYDMPVEGRAAVWAEVRDPADGTSMLRLDEEPGGQFAASFRPARRGVYTIRFRAAGSTHAGTPFEREQTLTAVTAAADPARRDQSRRLCELLECTLDASRHELERMGINIAELEKCLRRYCRELEFRPEERPLAREDVEAVAVHERHQRARAGIDKFARIEEGEAVPQPTREPMRMEGPMFDLSPEDKAAGAEAEETDEGTEHKRHMQRMDRRRQAPFDLSPEDKGGDKEDDDRE